MTLERRETYSIHDISNLVSSLLYIINILKYFLPFTTSLIQLSALNKLRLIWNIINSNLCSSRKSYLLTSNGKTPIHR